MRGHHPGPGQAGRRGLPRALRPPDPGRKAYMRAMADLGPGPHRSGEIVEVLGCKVTSAAPIRNTLISKGILYSPAHGDTAFTVPLFDGFMRRIMAG